MAETGVRAISNMQIFKDRNSASLRAALLIEESLRNQLAQRERAALVVSGGSTPLSCLQMLSLTDLPWTRIDVTLTDERDVPPDHVDSNEKMIRENLLLANTTPARYIGLNADATRSLQPFACTLVGMGEDGHFASLFPDSPQLVEGLTSEKEIVSVTTPSSPYSRVSMTLNTIANSDAIILLIFGDIKRRIVEDPQGFPVYDLLQKNSINVFWAP